MLDGIINLVKDSIKLEYKELINTLIEKLKEALVVDNYSNLAEVYQMVRKTWNTLDPFLAIPYIEREVEIIDVQQYTTDTESIREKFYTIKRKAKIMNNTIYIADFKLFSPWFVPDILVALINIDTLYNEYIKYAETILSRYNIKPDEINIRVDVVLKSLKNLT